MLLKNPSSSPASHLRKLNFQTWLRFQSDVLRHIYSYSVLFCLPPFPTCWSDLSIPYMAQKKGAQHGVSTLFSALMGRSGMGDHGIEGGCGSSQGDKSSPHTGKALGYNYELTCDGLGSSLHPIFSWSPPCPLKGLRLHWVRFSACLT
jgi:hypothetical protein